MASVMFVCLGNICRSPAAEGVLIHLARQEAENSKIRVASCGVGSWHVGDLPDPRMRQAASRRGVHLTSRAQQFRPEFFSEYDYILAVDREIREALVELTEDEQHENKVHLVCAYSERFPDHDIPDPYYGGSEGFDLVLDMLEDACFGWLASQKKQP